MSNPEIMLATFDPESDEYTVHVIKARRLEEARGPLQVYASLEDAASGDESKQIADLASDWYSPASMRKLGEGSLEEGARLKYVVAVQVHVDGTKTRSAPYQVE